jgi:hypothetical protein
MPNFGLNGQLRGLGSVLVILLLGAIWSRPSLHDYVSAGTARLVSGGIERLEQRENPFEASHALAIGAFSVTAAFARAFVRFDRKQNTRLWPFVTTGTTRSPPFLL